jgi:hypothetical protein
MEIRDAAHPMVKEELRLAFQTEFSSPKSDC